MTKIRATEHAKKRMQQRGISEMQVRLIKEFGMDMYQKGGENLSYIPEKTLAELRQAIDRLANVRIVLGDADVLVTTMHKHRSVHKTQYAA